jgi:MSHA biogenesis protein MshI
LLAGELLIMKLPWNKGPTNSTGRLAIAIDSDAFSYVEVAGRQVVRSGTEPRGADSPQQLAKRVRSLNLPGTEVITVLGLSDCQLLQIEAPAVPAEEMKAAARWQIKDKVDIPVEELTLDVLAVGDQRAQHRRQLFVAAARNAQVVELGAWMEAAGLQPSVFDITELAQRNLQCALAEQQGHGADASAALMVHGSQCLLTICANGELFYARRLDWNSESLGDMPAQAPAAAVTPAKPHSLMTMELEGVDIVDYGAEPDDASSRESDSTPRLAVEVQRSLDAWERSWPDLPLQRLWVQAGDRTEALQGLLMRSLSLAVEAFDSSTLFSVAPASERPPLMLLGGLLRGAARPT